MKKTLGTTTLSVFLVCLLMIFSSLTGSAPQAHGNTQGSSKGSEKSYGEQTTPTQEDIKGLNHELNQLQSQAEELDRLLRSMKQNPGQFPAQRLEDSPENLEQMTAEMEEMAKSLEEELMNFSHPGAEKFQKIRLEDIMTQRRALLQEIIHTLALDLKGYTEVSPGELGNFARLQTQGVSLPHFYVHGIPRELGDQTPWIFLGEGNKNGVILLYRASGTKVAYFIDLDPVAGWKIIDLISS